MPPELDNWPFPPDFEKDNKIKDEQIANVMNLLANEEELNQYLDNNEFSKWTISDILI